jgi:hypothetical protein
MSIGIPAGGEEKRVHHGEHGGARRRERKALGTRHLALGKKRRRRNAEARRGAEKQEGLGIGDWELGTEKK